MKKFLLLGVLTLLFAGVAYSRLPADRTEAAITLSQYENFSYNAGTQLATWNFRLTNDDTFNQTYTFNVVDPAGSIVTAVTGGTCTGLPRSAPVVCQITFPPGGNTLTLTVTSPFPQTCAAQVVNIGGVTLTNTNQVNLAGTIRIVPASSASFVGGISTPNNVPANVSLCPVNIQSGSTPVPVATPAPANPPFIPQVVQNPAVGGIFNGPRGNTPTPVRPVAVAPIVVDPGTVVLRPPSTGDAGLLCLQEDGPAN